jgi:hypothetical protein
VGGDAPCDFWSQVFEIAASSGPLVVCCLNKKSSPIRYSATGAIQGKEHNLAVTIGAGFVAYPHTDTNYNDRVSCIINEGVIKVWFIAKVGTKRSNAFLKGVQLRECTSAWDFILRIDPDDWHVILQKPGVVMQHNGAHLHFVFNLIDMSINSSAFTISTGYLVCSQSKRNNWIRNADDVGRPDATGMIKTVKKSLRPAFIRKLGKNLYKPVHQKKDPQNSKKGFQPGNSFGHVKKLLLHNS